MAVNSKQRTNQNRPGKISTIILCMFLSLVILIGISLFDWAANGFNQAYEHLQTIYTNNKVISLELNSYSISLINQFDNKNLLGRLDSNKQNLEVKAVTAANKANSFFEETVGIKGSSKVHKTIKETSAFMGRLMSISALTLKVALVKVLMMVSSFPLFAILGFVGLVDGLSQREIRRAELGRESSYLFHMLRKWVFRGIILLILLWVAAPFSIQPQIIFLPMSVLFAFMISLTAQRFKKYL